MSSRCSVSWFARASREPLSSEGDKSEEAVPLQKADVQHGKR
ncbi:hypothetical protein [Giesbergeria anulus]|jgi:hypothetical protein|nr:hypothetical protein [Giesbergeria anulus]